MGLRQESGRKRHPMPRYVTLPRLSLFLPRGPPGPRWSAVGAPSEIERRTPRVRGKAAASQVCASPRPGAVDRPTPDPADRSRPGRGDQGSGFGTLRAIGAWRSHQSRFAPTTAKLPRFTVKSLQSPSANAGRAQIAGRQALKATSPVRCKLESQCSISISLRSSRPQGVLNTLQDLRPCPLAQVDRGMTDFIDVDMSLDSVAV